MIPATTREHDTQRGEIIRILVPFLGRWMKINTLQQCLADLLIPLSLDDISYHLRYLANAGLVQIRTREQEPGFNVESLARRESQSDILVVALTNRGLGMYDRKIPLDPGVRF